MKIIKLLNQIFALTVVLTLATPAFCMTQMNGIASYNRFGQEQFLVAVYSDRTQAEPAEILKSDANKALELRIVDDRIFPRRFQRMWIEGLAINCSDSELEKHASNMADFSNMLNVQLRAGDLFRVERDSAAAVTVLLNGTRLGQINDASFFDLLLRSWIGSVPLSAELQESLRSKGDDLRALRDRFASIKPAAERVEAVAAAIAERDQVAKAAPAVKAKPVPAKAPAPAPAVAVNADQETEAGTPADTAATRVANTTPAPAAPAPATSRTQPEPVEVMTALDTDTVVLPASAETAVSAAGILMEQRYISQLTRWTQRFAKYPKRALRRNQEGTVQITVTVNRHGALTDVQLAEASKHEWLNDAAKEAVESASPFPPMPTDLVDDEFQFTVPVVFKLF